MNGDKIRFGENFIKRCQVNAELLSALYCNKWVVYNDVHAERTHPLCHFGPDASEPENAERLAEDFDPEKPRAVPLALPD